MREHGYSSAIALLLSAACAGGPSGSGDPGGGGGEEPPDTGAYYRYAVDDLILPGDGVSADDVAFDVDGTGGPDNALGGILSLLGTIDVSLQPHVDAAIQSGDLVSLHEIRADDLANDESVSWQVFLGMPMSESPKFDGTDAFTRDTSVNTDPLIGKITSGIFQGGPGELAISLTFGDQSIDVTLRGAYVRADISEGSCDGKLGGGLSVQELDSEVLPAVARFADGMVQQDCSGGSACTCAAGTIGKTVQEFFDSNGDCTVPADEIRANTLVKAAFKADVDLMGDDGELDSMSFGVGIHCVKASFNSPNE
jgi:hypothetical protein